ncbi:MAG TPA: putative porin [Myxococcota bacterium]|nr:putative porin [Myxococcota bacterium]
MREKGIISEDEYEDLYRRQARYEAEQESRSSLPGWLQNWTFGGSLRLRWERQDYGHGFYDTGKNLQIGQDNVDALNGNATGVRDRYRLRFLIGAEKLVSEGLRVGFMIGTSMGTSYGFDTCAGGVDCGVFGTALPGDPRSANSTLGGFFDPKNIYLDRAYVDWHPYFAPTFGLIAGKFQNPFQVPEVPSDLFIWDPDINPEGAAARYRFDLLPEALRFDGTAAFLVLNEIASVNVQPFAVTPVAPGDQALIVQPHYDERDPYMYGLQGAIRYSPNDFWKIGAQGSYYDLENMDTTLVAALNGLGNGGDSVEHDPLLVVLTPSSPLFQTGESKGRMEEVVTSVFATLAPFGPRYAVTPFFQWSSITNASSQNVGWSAGVDFGTPDLLKLTVMYADIERNGTVALFTDSDVFGGVTNAKGWYARIQRQITDAVRVDATFSKSTIAERNCAYNGTTKEVLCDTGLTENPALADAFNETKLDRLLIQMDLVVVF